jgi:hypothetical protein
VSRAAYDRARERYVAGDDDALDDLVANVDPDQDYDHIGEPGTTVAVREPVLRPFPFAPVQMASDHVRRNWLDYRYLFIPLLLAAGFVFMFFPVVAWSAGMLIGGLLQALCLSLLMKGVKR